MRFVTATLILPFLCFLKIPFKIAGKDNQTDFRFIVLSDFHAAEGWALGADLEITKKANQAKLNNVKVLKSDYGGDFIMIPGDIVGGHWYQEKFLEKLNVNTAEEAIALAADNAYSGMKNVFSQGGYSKIILAVGDHELGGNPWGGGTKQFANLPIYREKLSKYFHEDSDGNFLYNTTIGNAKSRPFGTVFEDTSFVYLHKNLLIITVDAFKTVENAFFDKELGLGGEGTVTCTVSGTHLDWFKSVLQAAKKDSAIDHIIVQAHLPILQPVRKINCSGQFMDESEGNKFWELMRRYDVDIYFAGEVHTNTVTKDHKSNLLQVVSRGNFFNNFITFDVTADTLELTSYNEQGTLASYNANYTDWGHLKIDKSGNKTKIESSGVLKLLDRWQPLLQFSFEEINTLESRPVLKIRHDDYKETLVQTKITIRDVECYYSLQNFGTFDQQYDAQVGNLALDKGIYGRAGVFNTDTRVGIWGVGPHSGGHIVSYAMWFKTTGKQMSLLHFGEMFASKAAGKGNKNILSLALDKDGIPVLYSTIERKLVPSNVNLVKLNDGVWNHIAVSMPKKSSLFSAVRMYVNGKEIVTEVLGGDDYLFFSTSGRMSIGGFGHSGSTYEGLLPEVKPYVGLIDSVFVWGRTLELYDINKAMEKSFDKYTSRRCIGGIILKKLRKPKRETKCLKKCNEKNCYGYQMKRSKKKGKYWCKLYNTRPDTPTENEKSKKSSCFIAYQ